MSLTRTPLLTVLSFLDTEQLTQGFQGSSVEAYLGNNRHFWEPHLIPLASADKRNWLVCVLVRGHLNLYTNNQVSMVYVANPTVRIVALLFHFAYQYVLRSYRASLHFGGSTQNIRSFTQNVYKIIRSSKSKENITPSTKGWCVLSPWS